MTLHLPAPASTRKLERGDDIQIERTRLELHNMQISDHRYLEKVFKKLRKKLKIAEEAPVLGIEALKTNDLIWGFFLSTTTKAAVHLGPIYIENLEVYRNTHFEELQNLFDITQSLILDHQSEILNVSTIDSKASSWTRPTLTHDQVTKWTKSFHRFRLVLGEDAGAPRSEPKMECSTRRISTVQFSQRIIWNLEWNIHPGRTSLEILQKIQKDLQDQNIEPENFEGRIIFMSMSGVDWTKRGNSEKCISNSEHVTDYAKRFSRGHWSFPGPGDEKKWCGTLSYTPEGNDSIDTEMV